jgi:hypothetical protein
MVGTAVPMSVLIEFSSAQPQLNTTLVQRALPFPIAGGGERRD